MFGLVPGGAICAMDMCAAPADRLLLARRHICSPRTQIRRGKGLPTYPSSGYVLRYGRRAPGNTNPRRPPSLLYEKKKILPSIAIFWYGLRSNRDREPRSSVNWTCIATKPVRRAPYRPPAMTRSGPEPSNLNDAELNRQFVEISRRIDPKT